MPRSVHLRYAIFLACTAALGGLLFGFDIAIITGAGPFLAAHFALTDIGLGWAFSSLLFGCVLGSLAAGRFTDRLGRKRMLVWVAALFALTSVATALAPTFAGFVAARMIGGFAVGAVSLLSPLYIAEVSPASVRGRLGSLYQMSIVIGILISYSINYLLRNTGGNNWRWMFLTGVIPSLLFLLLISLAPETPRFLVRTGRVEEGFRVLERIESRASAEAEIRAIKTSLQTTLRARDAMARPGVRRALAVSVCLAVLVQLSGINTIMDYAPAIFMTAGWKMDGSLAATFLIGINNAVFTLAAFWSIDRFGRRPLYIMGSMGMAFCLLGLCLSVLAGDFRGPLVLFLILAYLAFFSSCVGPVFWTLTPEIFPNDVRGIAMTVPVLVQWVANAAVVLLFPFAFHVIGKSTTLAFLAAMALLQAGFTWRFVPETKDKALEEIERSWIERKPAHKEPVH